jgi:hypothetical protein
VKNDYGTEYEARALNGLEEPLKKFPDGLVRPKPVGICVTHSLTK